MPSFASAGVTILEVYEGGVIAERHVFSHNSVFSQIAGPAAVAYAGHAIGDGYKKGGDSVTVNQEANSVSGSESSASSAGGDHQGHGHGGKGK